MKQRWQRAIGQNRHLVTSQSLDRQDAYPTFEYDKLKQIALSYFSLPQAILLWKGEEIK